MRLRMVGVIGVALTLLGPCAPAAIACTGIVAAADGAVLFGSNEDSGSTPAYLWFSPAPSSDGFGGVYYGLADRYPQGGMNERGLSFDHLSQPIHPVTSSSHLPTPPFQPRNGEWVYRMLEACETVGEALAYLSQYDLWFFERFQLLLADRHGAAAVVEGDRIVRKTGNTLVVTNFLLSEPGLGNHPCPRHASAGAVLDEARCISAETVRDALDRAHTTWTCYSNIHEPATGDVSLYYMQDYRHSLAFNVREELVHGAREFVVSDLLEVATRRTPHDRTALNGVDVEFSWYGRAVAYEIVLSTERDLSPSVVHLAPGCDSCGAPRRILRTVTGLRSNSTYYWMLRAQGEEGFWTESTVYEFTTRAASG